MDPKVIAAAREKKLLKEAFVSGLHGGSIWEINLVLAVVPICALFWSTLQRHQRLFEPYSVSACLIDFLLNVGGVLLATTIYSSQPLTLGALLLVPPLLINLTSPRDPRSSTSSRRKISHARSQPTREEQSPTSLPPKPFISMYRGTLLVITCICILAVDFRVFPRRFAKVETWGTSIMDIGVGSFVFAAGIVSARTILKERGLQKPRSLASRLISSIRHSLPLLLLGLLRLYSVKGLDYAEHVTEYGVHWNFFFTLGLLPPSVEIFNLIYKQIPSYAALACVLGIAYEATLDLTNLTHFIIGAPRDDLLSKNREGIFSFIGYLAIFLIGQSTGTYILPSRKGSKGWELFGNSTLKHLLIWSSIWSLLTYFTLSYRIGLNLQVSRRLANLPYILWIASFNTCQLTIFCILESVMFPNIYEAARTRSDEVERCNFACSRLLRAFNKNGLAIFLFANLLTGAVNLTLPTLTMNDMQAMAVLFVYMAVLSALALTLDKYQIHLKF